MKLLQYVGFICLCLMISMGASYATQCSYEGNVTTCKLNHPIYKQIQFDTEKRQVFVKACCGHQYIIPKENITLPQVEWEFWTDAQHLAQFFTNHAWVQIKHAKSDQKNKIQVGLNVYLKQKGGMYGELCPSCGATGCNMACEMPCPSCSIKGCNIACEI